MKKILFALILSIGIGSAVFATDNNPPTQAIVEEASVLLDEPAIVLMDELNAGEASISQVSENEFRFVRADGSGVTVVLDDKL